MAIFGTRVQGDERRRRLAAARQWRIDTKPYFDAIYGADETVPCPTCAGSGTAPCASLPERIGL